MASIPYAELPEEFRSDLNQRASNYDGTSGEDLYNMIPEHLRDDPSQAQAYFESREVGHIQSRANGGSDTPDNLELMSPEMNDQIGADNASPIDMISVEAENRFDAQQIEYNTWADGSPIPQPDNATVFDRVVDGPQLIEPEVVAEAAATTAADTAVYSEAAGESLLEILGETAASALEALAPVALAADAAYQVDKHFTSKVYAGPDNVVNRAMVDAAVAGGGYLLYTSTVAPVLITGRLLYGAGRIGWHLYQKHEAQQRPRLSGSI